MFKNGLTVITTTTLFSEKQHVEKGEGGKEDGCNFKGANKIVIFRRRLQPDTFISRVQRTFSRKSTVHPRRNGTLPSQPQVVVLNLQKLLSLIICKVRSSSKAVKA